MEGNDLERARDEFGEGDVGLGGCCVGGGRGGGGLGRATELGVQTLGEGGCRRRQRGDRGQGLRACGGSA